MIYHILYKYICISIFYLFLKLYIAILTDLIMINFSLNNRHPGIDLEIFYYIIIIFYEYL